MCHHHHRGRFLTQSWVPLPSSSTLGDLVPDLPSPELCVVGCRPSSAEAVWISTHVLSLCSASHPVSHSHGIFNFGPISDPTVAFLVLKSNSKNALSMPLFTTRNLPADVCVRVKGFGAVGYYE